MANLFKRFSQLICTVLLAALSLQAQAADHSSMPREYTALYNILRNHKVLGQLTVSLSHNDDIWTMHGTIHDVHGLAKLLAVKGMQRSTGRWQDDQFKPETYEYFFSVIGHKSGWLAKYDWPGPTITTREKRKELAFPLDNDTTDPLSISLSIRSHLMEGTHRFTINVVDRDEVKALRFQSHDEESTSTALGCFETIYVEHVLEKPSKRQTLGWYAKNLDFVPVRMDYVKKKGNDYSLRLISLEMEGKPTLTGQECQPG